MKIRCLVVLVVFSFFVMTLAQFCIPPVTLVYAQSEEDPEEEPEEEPMQSKPDPRQSKRSLSRQLMQKGTLKAGALKMKAASVETSEVMDDGEHGDAIMSEGAEGVNTEIVSMPIDPYGAEAGAESTTSASSVSMKECVGSASWDPTDSPAGWDPFDKEANLDSAEVNQ